MTSERFNRGDPVEFVMDYGLVSRGDRGSVVAHDSDLVAVRVARLDRVIQCHPFRLRPTLPSIADGIVGIPDGVQTTVLDLAERMEHFVERARNGGSWMELQTWLLSMQPQLTVLGDIGLDGIRGSVRMTITPERQEEIAATFTVPDSLPTDTDVED